MKYNYDKNSPSYLLAELLSLFVQLRRKTKKPVDLQVWAKHIDLMIRKDNCTPDQIADVIEWCQEDDFWRDNIMSTPKLRKQFKILEMQMSQNGTIHVDEENVQTLVKCYTRKFTNNSKLEVKRGDPIYERFSIAYRRIQKFCIKTKVIESVAIDYLLECLKEQYTDKGQPVMPGHLCSNHTWQLLLPQYLRTVFPEMGEDENDI